MQYSCLEGRLFMDEKFLEELRLREVDVDGALNRLSGDKALYFNILSAFIDEPTMDDLEKAIMLKKWDDAFTAVHALKGLAGNLGMTSLFYSTGELVIRIRGGKLDEIGMSLKKVRSDYDEIIKLLCSSCVNDRRKTNEQ